MADKPKGNFFLELLIVVLTVALIGTILYPKQVWEREDALESICHARMEALFNMELQYMQASGTWTYTDTLSKVKDVVLGSEDAVAALDSLLNWDLLVTSDKMKKFVLTADVEDSMRSLIRKRLLQGKPIRNLGTWDSLEYKLLAELKQVLPDSFETNEALLDTSVDWVGFVGGEMRVFNMIDNMEIPTALKRSLSREVRMGEPLVENRRWAQIYRPFYETLAEAVKTAGRQDVWAETDQDAWKELARADWEAKMDALTEAEQDSVWEANKKAYWDKVKDVIWQETRKDLWNREKSTWPDENEAMWRRIVSQQWEADRKKDWLDDLEASAENDSVLQFIKAEKDSLWRQVSDSLHEAEYPEWKKHNESYINEVIEGLWQTDRRVSWEEEAYEQWLEEKNRDRQVRWAEIKEELWNTNWPNFWREEEEKLAGKNAALNRLDIYVDYKALLGEEKCNAIVDALVLPDSESLWEKIKQDDPDAKGSSFFRLGVVGLFRNELLDSVYYCPVAKVPYLVHVVDTSQIKKIAIRCPITEVTDLSVGKYKPDTTEVTEEAGEMMEADAGMETVETDSLAADSLAIAADSSGMVEEPVEKIEEKATSRKVYTVALSVEPATLDTTKITLKLPLVQRLLGGGSVRPHGYIDEDQKKSWDKRSR